MVLPLFLACICEAIKEIIANNVVELLAGDNIVFQRLFVFLIRKMAGISIVNGLINMSCCISSKQTFFNI